MDDELTDAYEASAAMEAPIVQVPAATKATTPDVASTVQIPIVKDV